MTAINFNLDKAIAKADTKTVRIGGKDHELVFNDEMRNKLEELQIVVYSEAQAFDDNRDAFINAYTVHAGDTLSGIAAKFGTTWKALAQKNDLANPNVIYVGQTLTI